MKHELLKMECFCSNYEIIQVYFCRETKLLKTETVVKLTF